MRGLKFEEKPNYEKIKKLFSALMKKNGYDLDYKYDWTYVWKQKINRQTFMILIILSKSFYFLVFVKKIMKIWKLNLNIRINHALKPNFLSGKFCSLFWTLRICLVFWCWESLVLKALVSLVLKNWALLVEPWWRLPARVCLSFWLRMVRFLAIFFLTVLILASLAALPEDALAFLRFLNYSLSFSMLDLIVWESDSLIFWLILFSTIFECEGLLIIKNRNIF